MAARRQWLLSEVAPWCLWVAAAVVEPWIRRRRWRDRAPRGWRPRRPLASAALVVRAADRLLPDRRVLEWGRVVWRPAVVGDVHIAVPSVCR